MKSYTTDWIRNVGIVGHGDTGKTQLVSSLLYTAGMTPRLGKVADGSTTTDWDEEEIARKISINTGLAYAEWQAPGQPEKTKINLLDTPGYSTFINETKSSLIAADASLIVVDAAAGVQVVTEKVWDYATEYDQPRAFVLNWMDRELASFERALDSIEQVFGRGVVPIELPIGAEKDFRGVVDLVAMKALIYTPDGDGKAKIEEIPADSGRRGEGRARSAGRTGRRGRRRIDAGIFRQGHAPGRRFEEGPARGSPGQADLPRAAELRAPQHRQRRDPEFPGRDFPLARVSRKGRRPQDAGPQGRNDRAQDRRLRAGFAFRVQDRRRPVRRAHHLFQSDVRRAEERRDAHRISIATRRSAFSTSR